MDNMNFQEEKTLGEPLLKATMLAAASSVILVVFLTVVGELYSPLKDFLKESLYHHWVGKGVWSVVLFAVITLATYPIFKKRNVTTKTSLVLLNTALIAGTLILFLFFVYEYVIHH